MRYQDLMRKQLPEDPGSLKEIIEVLIANITSFAYMCEWHAVEDVLPPCKEVVRLSNGAVDLCGWVEYNGHRSNWHIEQLKDGVAFEVKYWQHIMPIPSPQQKDTIH